MKDVLEFILKNITTVPDDVQITEAEEEGGTNYSIAVNPADIGRIIGKEGKVIKAIRTIMRVIAIQKGVRVRVSVLSDDVSAAEAQPTQAQPTEPPAEAADPVQVVDVPSDEITVEV